ncbi:glycoside hydrolase family protein, partial [Glaesserella parasuis]|nr:glycoside hydrolase family protein [Glaesserella parasuis]MDE3981200.1 glycoside hydrolase family protein [Glaesserella parasuis]
VSKSTFFRKIKSGDYVGACNELPKWVYSGGKKLRGLEIRREKEKALCLAGLTN